MTTERGLLKALLLAVPLLGMAWLALLAGLARYSEAAPALFVPQPSGAFLSALPDDVRIAGQGRGGLIFQSDAPELAKRLYASGARLVLPAGLPACVSFTRELTPRRG